LVAINQFYSAILFNDLRGEMIVYFVDIGGIVDHQCLNFLFIKNRETLYYPPILYT
jgi:hypothetical protein